jgi:hypothetical protein
MERRAKEVKQKAEPETRTQPAELMKTCGRRLIDDSIHSGLTRFSRDVGYFSLISGLARSVSTTEVFLPLFIVPANYLLYLLVPLPPLCMIFFRSTLTFPGT